MASIKKTEHTQSLVQSFSGARSALEEVFQHYKVGRYGEAFLEKPYFLLSRCTHVLFSLWLAEQDSERGFFATASPPAAFALGLDFGELRYSEYKRRTLHTGPLEEHLRNETKWFEFWMRILQQFDQANTRAYQKFCDYVLAWAREPGFLEGKAHRADRQALRLFLTGHEAGRVLTGTIRVLEDLVRTIVGCFTTAEVRTCVVEQMLLLAGLLREMRRILVWETPAKGPYTVCRKARWRTQSPWQRLSLYRAQGLLTVIPKREGGEIICTFQPTPGSTGRRASWVRSMTSLEDTYEAELFATWSYRSGEREGHSRHAPAPQACWTVQNAEAGRLEVLSKQIDGLLEVLQRDPVCTELVTAVKRVSRNDAPEWTAMALPWTYVSQLDQLVEKLTFVYREAKAVGGDGAAQNVIERIWLSGKATTGQGDLSHGQNPRAEKTAQRLPSIPALESAPRSPNQVVSGTLASLLQKLGDARSKDEKNVVNEPKGSAISSEGAAKAKDAEPVSQESRSGSGASEAAVDREPRNAAKAAAAPEGAAVFAPPEQSQQRPAPAPRTASTDRPSAMDQALVRKLLDHHDRPGRTINSEPLSCADLQRDLGWSESKLQRAMTNVFGPKPVSVYRRKCEDRTISAFLMAQAGSRSPRRARPRRTGAASGTSAKGNPRRKSGQRLSLRR